MSAFSRFASTTAPLTVTHQGLFPAVRFPSSEARRGAGRCRQCHHGNGSESRASRNHPDQFAGTAQAYEAFLSSEPILLAAALVSVYLILAMLYESLRPSHHHHLQPSGGERGRAAGAPSHSQNDLKHYRDHWHYSVDRHCQEERIMMDRLRSGRRAEERQETPTTHRRSVQSCASPILMNHHGALLGALPLALGSGTGPSCGGAGHYHHRRADYEPVLTLYTTPVVYLYFDSLQHWWDGVGIQNPQRPRRPGPCSSRTCMEIKSPKLSRSTLQDARYKREAMKPARAVVRTMTA